MSKEASEQVLRNDVKVEDGIIYEYFLLSGESSRVASFKIPLYSITVKMTKDGETTEGSIVEVFADLGKATVFYEKLVANLATPIDLTYILEDRIHF